jgi:hypothetical protein
MRLTSLLLGCALFLSTAVAQKAAPVPQPNNADYTAKIREFTTAPYFTSELVDHLPQSSLPSPDKILGHIVGAPNYLTYPDQIYAYFRALEKSSPRVKVFSIGTTEEGHEIIMAAISDEQNIRRIDEFKQMAAKLADPRTTTPQQAEQIIQNMIPFYWLTGSIHSPETGSPEMLMELGYRLAADSSPMYERIRKNWITLITPVIEVDGRYRMCDLYKWHLANPGKAAPPLVYWGHYVAHDNNRDAMGLSLKLTQTAMKTFLEWHPLIQHDLHESVPFLYDNTLGTSPFNAWLDPIVTNEWEKIAWVNVDEMTKRGMPGVFTHGTFTTWDPSYLYFIANSHNSIGRLYETFGNGGADTRQRELSPDETSRTWWRPNPPLARALWSMRDNTNYQQSAILFSLDYLAGARQEYSRNFYLKSQRAVAKAKNEGPAAYVLPGNDPRPQLQADLVNLLEKQGAEVQRATAAFTVKLDVTKKPEGDQSQRDGNSQPKPKEPATREFPAGSYIVRMDQPYSRIADMLLDQQYYSAEDRRPYDDSGWSQGPLRNVETYRITDASVLTVPMEKVGEVKAPGALTGSGQYFAIVNNATPELATLRFQLADVPIEVADANFSEGSTKYDAGTLLVPAAAHDKLDAVAKQLGVAASAVSALPAQHHTLAAPRIALMHTWQSAQNEGWWRMAFDKLKIPYTYISDHTVRDTADLRSKFDVIVFPPVGGGDAASIVNGIPMWTNPLPWQKSELTPNLGTPDATDDMRGGMGYGGVQHLDDFINAGGLLITAMDTTQIPINFGLTDGVGSVPPRQIHARGTVLNAQFMPTHSPIAYGYGPKLGVYFNDGPLFRVTYQLRRFGFGGDQGAERPTGRGGVDSPDVPQGRPYSDPAPDVRPKPWEAPYMSSDVSEQELRTIIPEQYRPRVILRFADTRDVLYSGQLSGAGEVGGRPAVIDVPVGKGHVVMFAINPIWRGETQGSYALVFNAMLNYDHLDIGKALPPAQAPAKSQTAASDEE